MFINDIEQYLGKINKLELYEVDCLKGLLNIYEVTQNIDDILRQCSNFPESTSYVEVKMFNNNNLTSTILTNKLPII